MTKKTEPMPPLLARDMARDAATTEVGRLGFEPIPEAKLLLFTNACESYGAKMVTGFPTEFPLDVEGEQVTTRVTVVSFNKENKAPFLAFIALMSRRQSYFVGDDQPEWPNWLPELIEKTSKSRVLH